MKFTMLYIIINNKSYSDLRYDLITVFRTDTYYYMLCRQVLSAIDRLLQRKRELVPTISFKNRLTKYKISFLKHFPTWTID